MSGHDQPAATTAARDLSLARDAAFDALLDYGLLARDWNAPDDDHTLIQLEALLQEVRRSVFRDA